jgi:AAA15 family ATPase/GTPase
MIKTIEIENFQSHRYTVLDLHPGVNVIRGRSHSGKSCITRALRWCLLNEPQGFRFKPWTALNKDLSRVSVEFTEGGFVTRQRSSTKNEYIVNGEYLEAMRSEVPQEVTDVTHLSAINLQTQADQFYLLRGSPGAAARELNERVGLTIIDEKLSKAASIIKGAFAALRLASEEKLKIEEELLQYKNLDNHLAIIADIEDGIEYVFSKAAKKDAIQHLLKQINDTEQEMAQLVPWFQIKDRVKGLRVQIENHKLVSYKIQDIRGLIQKVKDIEKEQEELGVFVKLSATVKPLLQKAVKHRATSKETATLVRSISECCKSIETIERRKLVLLVEIDNHKAKRDELLKKHKQDFCSKCGSHRSYWRGRETK